LDIAFDGNVYCPNIKTVGRSGKGKQMFSDTLAFNPFDKTHSAIGTDVQIALRNKFLNSFGGQHIFCYNGDPRKKISSMNHTDHLTTVAIANDSQGADAYFYVNGGRKQYAISRIRACFVDMDAGRDDQGRYFKPSIVMQKKKEFLNQINNFPVKPSWVVDTRNGYQCYWILNPNTNSPHKTYWSGIQKKLVNHFGGDARAIKVNQIYRIPYTWWRKGWEGKQPYFTSILSGSTGNPINIEQLKQALDGVSAVVNLVANKTSDEWFKEYAKAYKKSDVTGVPVPVNVAATIANQMKSLSLDTYTNSTDNIKPVYGYASGGVFQKAYGDPVPVHPVDGDGPADSQDALSDEDMSLDGQQTKLLKTVVEFLNQVSTPLYFSNNRFLSNAAKELASKISDKFCIG
jgi:hypothetical protein